VTSVQHHIIRRQVLEVEVAGAESDGLALQGRLAEICRGWLAPALEDALERAVPGDEHWIIDRLEVDVGTIALETFERDLVEAVTQAIARRLGEAAAGVSSAGVAPTGSRRAAPRAMENSPLEAVPLGSAGQSGPIQRRTDAQSVDTAFLHFLATGILPWWFHLPAGKTLEDVVLASWDSAGEPAPFGPSLLDAMASADARTRLVRQFSDDFLRSLLASLSTEGVSAMQPILAEMARHGPAPEMFGRLSDRLWQSAFTTIASGRRLTAHNIVAEWVNALPAGGEPESRLVERIAQFWLGPPLPHDRTQPREPLTGGGIPPANGAAAANRDELAPRIDLEEGVYINCAGLVLLHPFLPRLFEALRIAQDDKLVQPDRALSLLHFLATGERRAPEYQLLLPKLLCNVPLAQPAAAPLALTVTEEEEAIALLEAVIRHWDALGDTSADGLRGTFLVRPGKLFQRGNGDDVLQVEAQSFDILLDRLPWGIGMIQLPWMEKMLWVEWRF
jgi:hypothetical protein